MFIPKGETDVIQIRIYTSESVVQGLWNVENNHVLLSPSLYSDFRNLKLQSQQKEFFSHLKKVSSSLLPF
jgi:hypothetical protein